MIKALGTAVEGGPLLLLGLSRMNCEKLLSGKPIRIDVGALSPDAPKLIIALCAGETERHIVDELNQNGLLNPNVEVHEQGGPHE